MAAIVVGTALIYGVAGEVAALVVQSYSCDSSFNNDITAQNSDGLTITHRMDDRMSDLTVEGIVEESSIPSLGSTIEFTLNAASAYPIGSPNATYTGDIVKISERGSCKGFATVSITAKAYEGA